LLGGLKVAFSAKLMKLGILGMAKAVGVSAVGGMALPISLGIGGASFLYNYLNQN
jgi:hypothetical protein